MSVNNTGENYRDDFLQGGVPDLAPPDYFDPVIEAYKQDIDRSLLRENLKLTPAERLLKFERNMGMVFELRRAGRIRREQSRSTP